MKRKSLIKATDFMRCEDYYWKGFGVNLLDSVARHNRPISEQEAYRLSDMIICGNYFSIIE